MTSAPFVFVGPSLSRDAVREVLPDAQVESPIARGDLTRLRGAGADTFLILDGAFAHRLAVAPSEIVDVLATGARVLGAASIGAIRAAECWPAGMDGAGAIHRLYRLGVLRDDDEVAVATDPDDEFRAVTIALVSIRFAILVALRSGLLDRAGAVSVLDAAHATHFAQRTWEAIFRLAAVRPSDALRALCDGTDLKRRDALLAVAHLRDAPSPAGATPAPGRGLERGLIVRGPDRPRYRGHDPHFGMSATELDRALGGSAAATDPRALMRWYAAQRG